MTRQDMRLHIIGKDPNLGKDITAAQYNSQNQESCVQISFFTDFPACTSIISTYQTLTRRGVTTMESVE